MDEGAAPLPDASAEPESLVVRLETGDAIHFLDWGEPGGEDSEMAAAAGRAPLALMLIHGLSATGWSWAPVARRLCGVTRVIAPDLRGHGLSDSPRTGYDLESLGYDLLTVLTACGIDTDGGAPAALVAGHGFGAMVAATMAWLRPRAIGALALVDGGFEDVAEATGLSSDDLARTLTEPPEVMRSMAAFLADRREYDAASWDADQERAARSTVVEKPAGHVAPATRPHVVRACIDAMFGYQPLETLGPYPGELLIVTAESGAADDDSSRERALAVDDVVRARTAGGGSTRVVRWSGTGHNLMRYRPAELATALLGLTRLTSGGTRGAPP